MPEAVSFTRLAEAEAVANLDEAIYALHTVTGRSDEELRGAPDVLM